MEPVVVKYKIERRNERWWACYWDGPEEGEKLQAFGATKADAVARMKEIDSKFFGRTADAYVEDTGDAA